MAEGQAAIQVFFTNDGLGVGVVSGVVRVTESESEQSEHFHFFRLRLRLGRLRSAYNLVKTRLKQKRKDKPITMHVPTLCDWFSSSASACDSDDPVFT